MSNIKKFVIADPHFFDNNIKLCQQPMTKVTGLWRKS